MRIGLIVPGGVDRSARVRVIPVLLALIERLARRHEVLVIAVRQEPEPCEYPLLGARVVNLGESSGGSSVTRWLRQLKKVIFNLRSAGGAFDVLHAFWVNGPGTVAVAAGRVLRVPVVVSIGGGELVWLPEINYGGQRSWLGRVGISSALRMADAVSACSQYSLRPLAERRTDALWVPWSVDTKVFESDVARPAGPPWRLLQVADLNEVKDHATMLKAIQLVLKSHPQIEVDCVGVDTLGGRVQAMARNLGLGHVVRFHGFLPLEEVVPFYQRAHLCLQSSRHENTPATVLEAAAAGVPTVGTAVGLVVEMAPGAAIAVPVRDPSAMAMAIVDILNDADRRYSLARSAQAFVRTYDADWTVSQFEAIYQKVTSSKAAWGPNEPSCEVKLAKSRPI
jgi:glycosyltransferase involved in cell wall biosynthesis